MSDINTGDGEGKKGRPKKMNLRVDFTPMVDMNMLLITFFMFCTTLSKPQTMDLVLPAEKKDIPEIESPKVDTTVMTILMAENDKVYYYFGKPNYEDYTHLKETNYGPDGIRGVLLKRNAKTIKEIAELRLKKYQKKVTEEEFDEQAKEIKKQKGQVVIIKPMKTSTFKNMVDVLDEMAICSIAKYAMDDAKEPDEFLIKNYLMKGSLLEEAAKYKEK